MKNSLLCFVLFAISHSNAWGMGSPRPQPPNESEILDPGEPPYCDPKTFLGKEVPLKVKGIENAHQFQLGEVTLIGVAVGNSDAEALSDYSLSHSTASRANKFCTWYYNEGNDEAEKIFTHIYLDNPKSLNVTTGPQQYSSRLHDAFANSPNSFLSCAIDHKYIAMGCQGQKHRGPTVFGMMLAYSGCKPERAATITNVLWGLNGVKAEVRLAIIREGKNLGDQNALKREQLQKAFH